MEICPFCQSVDNTKAKMPINFFNGKNFANMRCKNCNLLFLSPMPESADFDLMYSEDYHEEHYFNEVGNFSQLIEIIKTYPDGIDVLDYGCGDASFLNVMQSNGYNCTGVEFNDKHIDKLRIKYPRINFAIIEVFKSGNELYDIICIRDVLEHVDKPEDLLGLLKSKLKSGGIIFAQGPLENNFTISWLFIRLNYFLKYLLKKSTNHTPFHLTFANRLNQINFFNKQDLVMKYYKISETSWPYPASFKQVHNLGGFIKFIIAQLSMLIDTVLPFAGNRFIYIGKKI